MDKKMKLGGSGPKDMGGSGKNTQNWSGPVDNVNDQADMKPGRKEGIEGCCGASPVNKKASY